MNQDYRLESGYSNDEYNDLQRESRNKDKVIEFLKLFIYENIDDRKKLKTMYRQIAEIRQKRD